MRIKNLHLENFRGFEKLDIEFPKDSNVAVFIGENGSGKTTILDALRENFAVFFRLELSHNLDLNSYRNEANIKQGSSNYIIHSIVEQDNKTNISIQSPSKNSKFSQLISGGTGGIEIEENTNIPILAYFGSKIYSFTNGELPKVPFKQLLANYNALNAPLSNFEDFLTWFKNEKNRQDRLKISTSDLNYVSKEITVVSDAISKFLNGLSNNRFEKFRLETIDLPREHIYDSRTQDFLVINKDNLLFEINSLSAGEKILVQLVADISRRLTLANPSLDNPLEGTGIILIDEIELHLHPKWQRNSIPALTKTFPNIQFIITTHSPQVLSYVPNGSAFSVENGNVYPVNSYGRDNEWILETIMNDIDRPKEIKVKLDELFDLIRNNHIEKAKQLRSEIATLIGEDEAELLKADILIQRKNRAVLYEAH